MDEEIVATEAPEVTTPATPVAEGSASANDSWSYTAPKVEAQNLDAGNIAADADGVVVKGDTASESGTKNQGEGGEDKDDESKPEA